MATITKRTKEAEAVTIADFEPYAEAKSRLIEYQRALRECEASETEILELLGRSDRDDELDGLTRKAATATAECEVVRNEVRQLSRDADVIDYEILRPGQAGRANQAKRKLPAARERLAQLEAAVHIRTATAGTPGRRAHRGDRSTFRCNGMAFKA